ncbi:cyclin-dependent kinase [Rhizoctonia solani AG-3 Rhs1AP]|uniref:Cyclin-dependent kinase 8 n=2 Tax=Rhizoctonia solani AG-3 TaxID=1086053 RepID=A0A074SD84_9AGAM|nr:cyclin-dependent kinase [Rhizoctonia solani AG-3 Rhs1AP]KEP54768.1 cyclin-dependent kinase [Rhizoctonia solani 123E]
MPPIQSHDIMRAYRAKKDEARIPVNAKYHILGFISSGTYGRVYKAQAKDANGNIVVTGPSAGVYAIKKFKPDKEGEVITYTGISQSACREIALNREMRHENVIVLREVMLEDKSIFMVFEYAEHDFLQIIHHHSQTLHQSILLPVLKSFMYQLLNGLLYLHNSHILHRDLKPANILVTAARPMPATSTGGVVPITEGGVVKIGDLGLARLCRSPLQPLFSGDKVVVTIWYRAPELLLGARHYTKAIDCWAVGCIFAELLALRPIFKGEEAKLDAKKNVPFQRDQLTKIFDVLGTPTEQQWPGLSSMPEYKNFLMCERQENKLSQWYRQRSRNPDSGFDLMCQLFEYDPARRLDARGALSHWWFQEEPIPTANAFAHLPDGVSYPLRRVTQDEAPLTNAPPALTAGHGADSRPGSSSYLINRMTSAAGPVPGHQPVRKKSRME